MTLRHPRGTMALLVNFILFQLGWFACVLAPAPWDIAAGILTVAAQILLIAAAGEWRLIATVALAGAMIDSSFAAGGVFIFNAAATPWQNAVLAPPWLILLWANFAATLRHSLVWLRKNWLLAAVCGGIAGPAAYWGGALISDKMMIAVSGQQFILLHAPLWAVLAVVLPRWAVFTDNFAPSNELK